MTASHSSSLVVNSIRSRTNPALLTRTSRRPKVSTTVATSRRAPSHAVMSSVFATALPPRAAISSRTPVTSRDPNAVTDAVFRQFGVTRVGGLDELLDVSAALACVPVPRRRPRGRGEESSRVCVYAISGGTGGRTWPT